MKPDLWKRAAAHTGFELSQRQIGALVTYRDWLLDEAVPAGGLGPAESDRVDRRHIADALLFATPLEDPPGSIADLGSGVGLPGIPLAILLPNTQLTLVDRAGKRADLLRRAVRILDLGNVEVRQMDIEAMDDEFDVIVSRATIPPFKMRDHADRLLMAGGTAILGGSWKEEPVFQGWAAVEIPAEVLDRPVWILIMRQE